MATVLLIITIPTELEELRKRQEQLTKKQDIQMSIGRSSCRSDVNDTGAHEKEKPHINEAVKKAILLLNNSQQRNQSSLYPRASEIFDLKNDTITDANSRMANKENSAKESSVGPEEKNGKDSTVNESISKTNSREIPDNTFAVGCSKVKKEKSNTIIESELYASLETVMRAVLKELGITNALWTQTSDGRMYQILFTISFDEAYEELLCELHEKGVGERAGSTIAVLNCIASKKPLLESPFGSRREDPLENADDRSITSNEYVSRNRSGTRSQSRYRKSVWERFMNSVRSRLNIAQIIRCVRQDATIDFDFVTLLISAALLSAFGLMDDSLVFLASSMLISPLMGPIIAAIFGTAINDPILRNMGIRNECYGILIAIIVGFCFGVLICLFNPRFHNMEAITNEMMYRGALHTLFMCSIAAIPSGAAVAIGILNGNMGSLIGVAISASLLPPAVNSGMLWAMVIFCLAGEINTKGLGIYEKLYFDDTVWDFIAMSGVSIGITVLNILLVFVTGVLLLKVKEIVPGIGGNNREFWKRDIKIARNISQQNLSPNEAILEELSNLPSEERVAIGINSDMLRCMQVPEGHCQHTWSPGYLSFENRNINANSYATVHRLDYLYSTITNQGFTNDFQNEYAGPSGRRTDFDNVCRNDMQFKYYMSNERDREREMDREMDREMEREREREIEKEKDRNRTIDAHRVQVPSPSPYRDESPDVNTLTNTPIRRVPPIGQVRRFFITPVENSEQDPDEYDV